MLSNLIPGLRRWLPLLGVAVLASSAILRALGAGDAAAAIETLGGLLGAQQASAVPVGELAAAIAAAAGVVLKVRAEIKKATGAA
jgi:hypothetical protein